MERPPLPGEPPPNPPVPCAEAPEKRLLTLAELQADVTRLSNAVEFLLEHLKIPKGTVLKPKE